ncbi:MAG TPA: hypothetical protein VFJ16_02220 [Longimicrobium sp.]|nr:hypothetical protein [Longimicrobium sp.]
MSVRSWLVGGAVGVGAAVLSAFVFVAFFAPGWPRTVWGWLIATALGLPLLVLGEIILTLCFQTGPRRWNVVRRYSLPGAPAFRYPAGSRAGRALMLAARVTLAVALCAGVLWLLYAVFLGTGVIRAQFRG